VSGTSFTNTAVSTDRSRRSCASASAAAESGSGCRQSPRPHARNERHLRHVRRHDDHHETLEVTSAPHENLILTAWSAGWTTKLVAQRCTLPYRRIVFCGASSSPSPLGLAGALPIGNRRYRRLKICATVLRSICRQSHGLHSNRRQQSKQRKGLASTILQIPNSVASVCSCSILLKRREGSRSVSAVLNLLRFAFEHEVFCISSLGFTQGLNRRQKSNGGLATTPFETSLPRQASPSRRAARGDWNTSDSARWGQARPTEVKLRIAGPMRPMTSTIA